MDIDNVIKLVQQDIDVSADEIRDFVHADWREPGHESWLESSSDVEVADWVVAGLK